MTMKILILLHMLCLTPVDTSTCHVAPVMRGDPATITCDFKVDVNQTKMDFNIYKYSIGGHSEEILSCIWLDSHHPSCDDIKNGYVFNGSAASSLSLVIPSAREEHVGRYVCQVVQADRSGDDIVPCSLRLKGSNPEANTEHRDEKPESSAGLIAGLVVAVVVLITIILAIIFVATRREKGKGALHARTDSAQGEIGDIFDHFAEWNRNRAQRTDEEQHTNETGSMLSETDRYSDDPVQGPRLINLCGEEWKRRLEDAIEQTLEEAGKGQCPRVRRDDGHQNTELKLLHPVLNPRPVFQP